MKKKFLYSGIKRIAAGILCASLMGNIWHYDVKADYVVLAITEHQEHSKWCWVACARGLAKAKYYVTASQTDAVTYVMGSPVNEMGTEQNIVDAAKYFTNFTIPFHKSSSYLSYSEIQTKIVNSIPVVACRGTYSLLDIKTGAHAVLIVGYNTADTSLRYCDPADGEIHSKTYGDMLYESDFIYHTVWEKSVYK